MTQRQRRGAMIGDGLSRIFLMQFLAVLWVSITTLSIGQDLIGGDFESGAPLTSYPVSPGVWGVDGGAYVTSGPGISPQDGAQMLQFLYTSSGGGGGISADLFDLIDLGGWGGVVALGEAVADGSIWFNRIAGDPGTDTEFVLSIRAYDGAMADFPTLAFTGGHIAIATTVLQSDDDPATWEQLRACLPIPPQSTFLAVLISAVENIDPGDTPELDGHFADTANVTIRSLRSFRRGDANDDGTLDITDAVVMLNGLFLGDVASCDDARDVNDDGVLDIADPVYVLVRLFELGPEIPPPSGACGEDPSFDFLCCQAFISCP